MVGEVIILGENSKGLLGQAWVLLTGSSSPIHSSPWLWVLLTGFSIFLHAYVWREIRKYVFLRLSKFLSLLSVSTRLGKQKLFCELISLLAWWFFWPYSSLMILSQIFIYLVTIRSAYKWPKSTFSIRQASLCLSLYILLAI